MQDESNENSNNLSNTEISDLLLKWLKSHGGTRDKDQQSLDFCKINKIDWVRYGIVRELLKDEDLIEIYGEQEHHLRLKKDGWKAADLGLVEFVKQKEEKNKSLIIKESNLNFGTYHGQQNINQSSGESSILTNQIVNKPPKTETKIIRDILIGLIVTIVGGLILYFLTRE